MKGPPSILPSSRGPAAGQPQPPALAVPAPVDESLGEGVKRRLGALARDLREPEQRAAVLLTALLTGLLLYSYWPGLKTASFFWMSDPQYSHGWIVPLCSLAMLFWWREPVGAVPLRERLAGLGLLVASFLVRLWCANYRIITIDMYTFVPALVGVFLMTGGLRTLRWAWAPIAVLIFMYPLPDEATRYLLGPLQTLATMVSTYALQTLGLDAYREGNKIVLGDSQVLGVVDACSGLRMLTIFVWLAFMIVLVLGGEWWQNLVIMASSVLIALVVNSIRITVTGVMYTVSPAIAEKIFHDWAGYFMMPLALVMLFGLHALLLKLVVEEEFAPATVIPGATPRLGPAVVSAGAKRPETGPRRDEGAPAGN